MDDFVRAVQGVVRDVELPTSPFGSPMEPNTVREPTATGGAKGLRYTYKVRREVFVIYIPPGKCPACRYSAKNKSPDSQEDELVDLLDGEAGKCTHTRVEDYESTVNDCLSGKFLLGGETEHVMKDGTILISLKWFEPILVKKSNSTEP